MHQSDNVMTLEDVLRFLDKAGLSSTRKRDMVSAVRRICEMAGTSPAGVSVEPPLVRGLLAKVRPAAHNISAKSYSNLKSLLAASLQLIGVVDPMDRGRAKRHSLWEPLLKAISDDKRLSNGLAAFANWCTSQGITPNQVNDAAVERFLIWLEARTLYPRPRDLVRRVPNVWNEAGVRITTWPTIKLTALSFRVPSKHLQWEDFSPSFRRDVEAYLTMRAEPDLFDERPGAPRRPLAATTLRQQREHLRLAASILTENGEAQEIASLANLIRPESFKTTLRYYHSQANGEPNAFVIGLATTLIQVAQYHTGATTDEVRELKRIAGKLQAVPFDLTPKNKTLLRQLESERLRARLLFLPDQLMGEVAKSLENGRVRFVDAQVAVAIDILLAIPLRPQNLTGLNWQHHFSEPNGSRGHIILHIPAQDTKTKRQEIVIEVPDDVGRRLRWYRRHVLLRLGADVNGNLFVTKRGSKKSQGTLTQQIVKAIARHIGIHMTPHQFRHFGANSYLEHHPEDFETARSILGHAWSKTTRIYAGSSTRRASRAYNQFLFKQREELKLRRPVTKRGR